MTTQTGYDKRPFSTLDGAINAAFDYMEKYGQYSDLVKIEMDGSVK